VVGQVVPCRGSSAHVSTASFVAVGPDRHLQFKGCTSVSRIAVYNIRISVHQTHIVSIIVANILAPYTIEKRCTIIRILVYSRFTHLSVQHTHLSVQCTTWALS
jgi:hypothetical protein